MEDLATIIKSFQRAVMNKMLDFTDPGYYVLRKKTNKLSE